MSASASAASNSGWSTSVAPAASVPTATLKPKIAKSGTAASTRSVGVDLDAPRPCAPPSRRRRGGRGARPSACPSCPTCRAARGRSSSRTSRGVGHRAPLPASRRRSSNWKIRSSYHSSSSPDRDHVLQVGQLGDELLEAAAGSRRRRSRSTVNDARDFRVAQLVLQLVVVEPRAHRHDDGAELRAREQRDDPLGAVRQVDRDAIARPDARARRARRRARPPAPSTCPYVMRAPAGATSGDALRVLVRHGARTPGRASTCSAIRSVGVASSIAQAKCERVGCRVRCRARGHDARHQPPSP